MYRDELQKHREMRQFEMGIKVEPWNYVQVGQAFAEIRDSRYYFNVLKYRSLDAYCRDLWGMGYNHVNRIIAAAWVAENLACMGTTPRTERQARPLTVLMPAQQRKAWAIALRSAKGGVVTTKMVTEAAEKVAPRKAKDCESCWDNLMLHLRQAGVNVDAIFSSTRVSKVA